LVPLLFKEKSLSKLAGVRMKCSVKLLIDKEEKTSESGEVIINKDNISGIPVMQLSRYAVNALDQGKEAELVIDLVESMNKTELCKLISKSIQRGLTCYESVSLLINDKLADYCIRSLGISPDAKPKSGTAENIERIVNLLKHFKVQISGDCGFNRAQVTCGGVDTGLISENMESKIVSNLYFVGEVLDIDGTCGGYNIQWAFTSGYLAGVDIAGK